MKPKWLGYVLVAACLWTAAITALLVWKRSLHPHPPALPAYSLVVEAGAEQTEGADPAGWTVGPVEPEATLTLVLRPAHALIEPVVVRSFLGRDGRSWPWVVAFEPLGSGVFLLRASIEELPDLRPGLWELCFLVGRPEELPREPPSPCAPASGERWQLLRIQLLVGRAS